MTAERLTDEEIDEFAGDGHSYADNMRAAFAIGLSRGLQRAADSFIAGYIIAYERIGGGSITDWYREKLTNEAAAIDREREGKK